MLSPGNRGKVAEKLHLMEIAPEDLAQQLTLLEFSMYKSIDPLDILNYVQIDVDSTKSQQIDIILRRSSQVIHFYYFSLKTTRWVATEIVKESNVDKMNKKISLFIQVAKVIICLVSYLQVPLGRKQLQHDE